MSDRERSRVDDLCDLGAEALQLVANALKDGEGHHPAGSWMEETEDNQLAHMREHLRMLLAADDGEDHLSHLLCRTVILAALRARKHG